MRRAPWAPATPSYGTLEPYQREQVREEIAASLERGTLSSVQIRLYAHRFGVHPRTIQRYAHEARMHASGAAGGDDGAR